MVEGKIMFSIYRDATYNGDYHVVYFTELNEHNKDEEINRAIAGETFLDGYLHEHTKAEAKVVIAKAIRRMNDGEALTEADVRAELGEHLV